MHDPPRNLAETKRVLLPAGRPAAVESGSVRARGEEVRSDRRPADRVLPLPAEPAPAGRLHRRPQRAGARVQQGRQGRHARPQPELPGVQVLRRELPCRGAEHHEAPSKAGYVRTFCP